MQTEFVNSNGAGRFSPPFLVEQAWRGQSALTLVGLLMLVTMVPTGIAMGVDDRTLNGVSVWNKPLKFQVSLALHLFTLAWLMLFIPGGQRQSLIIKCLVAIILTTSLFEIGYITFQAANGEGSHFNTSTPMTSLMYSLMGMAAVALLVATGCIGAIILRYCRNEGPVAFAAGLGIVLGSVLGTATGIYLGSQSGHWVGGAASDANGLPFLGWSRNGGDLRVAHFAGLHAIQVLPLTAWVLQGRFSPGNIVITTVLAGVLLTVLTGAVFLQAIAGAPLIPG